MAAARPMKVLICGSGIAGSSFATWLLRAHNNAAITIVERAPALRLSGAAVDVRGAAVDVMKRMGVEEEVRANHTGENGIQFIRSDGSEIATLGATGSTEYQSITSEYEIMRGKLADIIIQRIKDNVDWVFNDYVQSYDEKDSTVNVVFNSGRTGTYDLLVGADGTNSKIRTQLTGEEAKRHVHDEGVHISYYTANADFLGGSKTARMYSAPGGRVIFARPHPEPGKSSILMMRVRWRSDIEARTILDNAVKEGSEAYKELMREQYKGAGWKCDEIIKGMDQADDFYCSNFAQTRVPKWHSESGRVVLLGDAAYATPGMGTSMAIMGSYILAGEILTHPDDLSLASKRYEEILRPFVKSNQGDDFAMQVFNPQSERGLMLRNAVLMVVGYLKLDQIALRISSWLGLGDSSFKLDEYPWPTTEKA